MPVILFLFSIWEKQPSSAILKTITVSLCVFFVLNDYVYFKIHTPENWTTKWYLNHAESDLTYLKLNTHTGEPYGWECYYYKCE